MWLDIYNFNFSLLTTSFTASETMSKLSYVRTIWFMFMNQICGTSVQVLLSHLGSVSFHSLNSTLSGNKVPYTLR